MALVSAAGLTDDLLAEILARLSRAVDLVHASSVCAQWRRVAFARVDRLWRELRLNRTRWGAHTLGLARHLSRIDASPTAILARSAGFDAGGTDALARTIRVCSAQLSRLELFGSQLLGCLGDTGAEAVGAALRGAPLRVLVFSQHRIGKLGGMALGRALPTLAPCSLARLDLSCNRLGAEGCAAVAQALPALRGSLEVLDLSHNGIDDNGAVALGLALLALEGATLRALCLNGNVIGDRGCLALCDALPGLAPPENGDTRGLEELYLDSLWPQDAGTRALLSTLPRLRATLRTLHLGHLRSASPAVQLQFAHALPQLFSPAAGSRLRALSVHLMQLRVRERGAMQTALAALRADGVSVLPTQNDCRRAAAR